VSALHCGFVRDLDGASDEAFGDATDLSMEPGSVRVLPSGADVTFPPTSDFGGVDAFLKHMLRQIAAGTGCPYELLASDLSETSYSSAKMGRENWERRCRALRSSVLEYRFLLPCWRRFVVLEILSGRINASAAYSRDPRPFEAVIFLWPAPAALDPLKEAQADVLLLRAGIASRQETIERRGRDFVEVQAEIDADSFEQPASNVTSITGEAA
jgi:capsid protein